MDTKNTVILLIFLLSIIGLLIGIHYTEEIDSNNSVDSDGNIIYENSNGVIIIKLDSKENNDINKLFT